MFRRFHDLLSIAIFRFLRNFRGHGNAVGAFQQWCQCDEKTKDKKIRTISPFKVAKICLKIVSVSFVANTVCPKAKRQSSPTNETDRLAHSHHLLDENDEIQHDDKSLSCLPLRH